MPRIPRKKGQAFAKLSAMAILACLLLTAVAARSNTELERLKDRISKTAAGSKSFPSFTFNGQFSDDAAAFDHKYIVPNEKQQP